jgi:chemotaxis protein CheY-P-specific phosphatase CheC
VEFTGAIAGSLEVLLTADLADELGVVMMGETAGPDLPDAQLKDVAGEMANILCGALLRRAGHEFRLKPPETCVAAAPSSADGYMLFLVNDRPLLVRSSVQQV